MAPIQLVHGLLAVAGKQMLFVKLGGIAIPLSPYNFMRRRNPCSLLCCTYVAKVRHLRLSARWTTVAVTQRDMTVTLLSSVILDLLIGGQALDASGWKGKSC